MLICLLFLLELNFASLIIVSSDGSSSLSCGSFADPCVSFSAASQSSQFKPEDESVTIFVSGSGAISVNASALFRTSNQTSLSFIGNGVTVNVSNSLICVMNTTSARLSVRGFNFVYHITNSTYRVVPTLDVGIASVSIEDCSISCPKTRNQYLAPRFIDNSFTGNAGPELNIRKLSLSNTFGLVWNGNTGPSVVRVSNFQTRGCISYVALSATSVLVDSSMFEDSTVTLSGQTVLSTMNTYSGSSGSIYGCSGAYGTASLFVFPSLFSFYRQSLAFCWQSCVRRSWSI
jgi:hypothetical protein